MADKTKKSIVPDEYQYKYHKDYTDDWDIHKSYISSFDPLEAMLIGQVYDSVSKSVDGSKITDSYAATLAIERASRVVGKLPEGETESIGSADEGKAAFMDILRQKWIYPNASAQHPFETKIRLWQLYSSVYGYMPMFYDWNVSPSGYVGPDCWLWNPRNLIPQQGRTSISDMDYVTALTWVSKKYIDNLLAKSDEELEAAGWNIEALKILSEIAQNEVSEADTEKDTEVQRTRTPQAVKKGICLATRYEAGEGGRWITFAPDHSCIQVRDIENPHKNGRIPFVIKYSQPLFDSFYGLGDFQRAKPLQFARDGLTNYYFTGIKNNLVPPLVVNANGVLKHTVDYRPGGVIEEIIPGSVKVLETSTAGLATYESAQTSLTGSLLSLYGSQNASIPGAEALNPSQGKTPAAINMYSDKEATRDGQERAFLEQALEQLQDGFNSLIVNIGTEQIPVALFSKDIKDIYDAGMTDIEDLFQNFQPNATETGGTLIIDPEQLRGVEYRFKINRGSTAKISKQKQLEELSQIEDTIAKFQNIFKDDPRVEVNWSKILETRQALTDIKGVKDFVNVNDGPSPREQALMEQMQQMQEQMQQMQEQLQAKEADQNKPTINKAGAFADPDVASAADLISSL